MFRANEALAAAKASAEQREADLRATQDALAAKAREASAQAAARDMLEREARDLRVGASCATPGAQGCPQSSPALC